MSDQDLRLSRRFNGNYMFFLSPPKEQYPILRELFPLFECGREAFPQIVTARLTQVVTRQRARETDSPKVAPQESAKIQFLMTSA